MKRLVIPVLGSSLLLWAVTASAAVVAPGDDPSFRVELTQVRVVAPGHGKWYSSWSFKCELTGDNSEAESVRLEVWDDSFKARRRAIQERLGIPQEKVERLS